MNLVPNWRKGWRMFSIQAQALALATLGSWQALPEDLKAVIPADVVFWCAMGMLVAGIVGRLVDQPTTREA